MSVVLEDVKFAYGKSSNSNILDINHWSVDEKEKCFVYGVSGAGKTTLLNIIGGLIKPNTGSVTVLNERIDKMSNSARDKFRAHNMGYIFQQFNLIHYLSAIENIELAHHFGRTTIGKSKLNNKNTNRHNKSSTADMCELLERLGIQEKDWQKPASQLSVGQQQRVGIARAFINKPKLIIADEPTSALDQTSVNSFMSQLTDLCDETGASLIFVSHDNQLQSYFNKVQSLTDINRASKGKV